jgi:hypothetical protein
MSDIEVRDREELVLPHTGELVDLNDELACGVALDELRRVQAQIGHAVRAVSEALAARAAVLGTKTIPLSGGRQATIGGGTKKVYDAQEIEKGLRALGMPEDRIRDIVVETVTWTVKAVEAKRAAAANPAYADVIESAVTEVETPVSVSIRKKP